MMRNTIKSILGKYSIEPRARSYGKHDIGCWLVAVDKASGVVVCDPNNNHHSHMRFCNADEAIAFLVELERKGGNGR